jgi:hypothetical protein
MVDGEGGAMRESGESNLWLTFRGAIPSLGVAWLTWVIGAPLLALLCGDAVGMAGALVPIVAAGWLLARHLPSPVDCLRRFHLDDGELTVMGPGRLVRRISWTDVEGLTQDRQCLTLRGAGPTMRVPLAGLRTARAWGTVMVRVVPSVAAQLWTRLESGALTLRPALDPPTPSVAWWVWLPLALSALALNRLEAILVVVGFAAGERALAWGLARTGTVTVTERGIELFGRRGRDLVPWGEAVVTPSVEGLGVGRPGREPGLLSTMAADFWAAAPVIELRAQLGPDCPSEVCFRARIEAEGLAVVGEIEALS